MDLGVFPPEAVKEKIRKEEHGIIKEIQGGHVGIVIALFPVVKRKDPDSLEGGKI